MQTLNEFNGFCKAVNHLQQLPPTAKIQAFDFIEFLYKKYEDQSVTQNQSEVTNEMKTKRQAGSLAGQIVLADDFDDPLNDFEDYM